MSLTKLKGKSINKSKKYVIAHVIYRFGMGGLENGLVNVINRLPDDEYQHVIICMTDHTTFSNRLNKSVDIYDMHKKPGKDFMLFYRLWKLFRKIKPDIVHSRNMSALESQLPAFLAGVPIRIHGEHGRDVHDLDGRNKRYQSIRKFFRSIVDYYIPLSKDLENYLSNTIEIKKDKIITICNGVDTEKFQHQEHINLKLPGLPTGFINNDTVVVGTVGRLEDVKDQPNLLEAFIELLKSPKVIDKDIKLILVGDGALKDKLQKQVNEAGLQNKVWLAGAREDVPELMHLMTIFVLPSLAEGISNTILEAMACSLPVIATNVGGNAELIMDGQTGFIVPRADPCAIKEKCLLYIESPELIRKHGDLARKRIEEKFSIINMVQNYNNVYLTSLKEKIA